jgi:hypothetical protein
MGPLCAIEVRGGPMPVSASQGVGTIVHVTMAEPVEGRLRLSINLADAFGRHCAVAIADGKIVRGDVPFGDQPVPGEGFPADVVAGRPSSGG